MREDQQCSFLPLSKKILHASAEMGEMPSCMAETSVSILFKHPMSDFSVYKQ